MISIFYNEMKNMRITGPKGLMGEQGDRGIKGQCQINCVSNNCSVIIKKSIVKKFNQLSTKSFNNNTMSDLERQYYDSENGMSISIDIIDPKTNIKITSKFKNDLLEKMVLNICQSDNYNIAVNAFKPKESRIIDEIIDNGNKNLYSLNLPSKFKFPKQYQEIANTQRKHKYIKIDHKKIINIINDENRFKYNDDFIKDIKDSYKDIKIRKQDELIKDGKKFTPDNVQNYIKKIFNEWIELIYNSLDNPFVDFFNKKYTTNFNTSWKNNKNPFDEIKKYDLYE